MAPFDEVAATFWDPDDDEAAGPATADLVAATEKAVGVTLPETLVRLLRLRNGGVVFEAWDAFPTGADDHVLFDVLLGAGPPDVPDSATLGDTPYLVAEWGLPSPVLLLSGDGHTWVALDYRVCGPAGEPSVVWLDADRGSERALAPDFRTFVEGLRPSAEFG